MIKVWPSIHGGQQVGLEFQEIEGDAPLKVRIPNAAEAMTRAELCDAHPESVAGMIGCSEAGVMRLIAAGVLRSKAGKNYPAIYIPDVYAFILKTNRLTEGSAQVLKREFLSLTGCRWTENYRVF